MHAWRETKHAPAQKGDRNCNRHFKDQVYLCTKHKYVNRSILASTNVVNEIVCVSVCARHSPVKSSSYCRAEPLLTSAVLGKQ